MQVIQIISIIGSIAFFITVVELIRYQKLKEAYGIIWLIFSFLFMIFSFWRKGLDYVSELLGIYYPPAMLFLLLNIAGILVMLQFSTVISKQNDQIRKLTQEIALLKQKNDEEKKH